MLVVMLLGIALRLRIYLENRSLWLDPAMLALNIIDKDMGQLLGRLDMGQAAPPGFLLLSKTIGANFDYSEYSLRLAPLIFGIAALMLFIRLSSALFEPPWATVASLLLATSSTAIFYCAEFRPQSADLFFAVLILLGSQAVLAKQWSPSAITAFVIFGVVAVWFSYAAAFVIVGSGTALVLLALASPNRRSAIRMAFALAIVAAHFLFLYLVHIRPSIGADLYTANTAAFAPLLAVEESQRWWWILAIRGYFENPLGFRSLDVVPMVALAVGVIIGLTDQRYRSSAALMAAPMVVLFAASGLGLYPIATGVHEVKSRFVLFTVPMALFFIAVGTSRLCEAVNKRKVFQILVVALLLIPSLHGGITGPRFRGQEMRPLVYHLRRHMGPGDTVYVFHASAPAFRYYTRHQPIEAVIGRSPRGAASNLADDLRRVRKADRLWVVVSHAYGGEQRVIRDALNTMGSRTALHRYTGAVLFEYQLDQRRP
jgi:hypothetical protein